MQVIADLAYKQIYLKHAIHIPCSSLFNCVLRLVQNKAAIVFGEWASISAACCLTGFGTLY